MTLVGCDLHTRKQQVAVLDTATGERLEQELEHAGDAVERFYAALPRPVTVGIESTGYALWFHALMQRLGHTLLVGEAVKIRAMVVRKTKTDRRDARHLLDLLKHDRFPTVWIPDPTARDLRTLLTHRHRFEKRRGYTHVPHDPFIDDSYTAARDGAHSEFLMSRHAKLPDDQHIQWQM